MRLTEANAEAHRRLEAQLMAMLGAAVDGRAADARRALDGLRALFGEHLAAEEARTLPLLRELGGPLHKLAVILDGDHRILHRSLDQVGELLADAGDDGPEARRHVLGRIEVFGKLKSVLEHHGVREQEDVYAPLDQRFPDAPWATELVPGLQG